MRTHLIFWTCLVTDIFGFLFFSVQDGLLSACNLLVAANLTFILLYHTQNRKTFFKLLSIIGKTKHTQSSEMVIEDHIIRTNKFVKEIESVISNLDKIGQQDFIEKAQKVQDDNIRASLLQANSNILSLKKKEQENNWVTVGAARLMDLKHKINGINEYSLQVLITIIKYVGANQGSFFLLKECDGKSYFELTAAYAYGKKKFVDNRIYPGEGLIGQLYYEKEIIHLTDIPKDYVRITSGLGEALPRCICIVPLLSEGNLHGAIEIASFKKMQPYEMEYMQKISESIGAALGSIESVNRTEALLQETQKMALEVKAQEEELRQNMEELRATQEQMRRKQSEMDAVLSSLSTVELDLAGNVIDANSIFLGITGYSLTDIQGKLYKSLIPQKGNDPIQYEIMWNSILSGRSFSGEFRIVNNSRKEMWMAGNFTPILGDSGKPYKVMVISLFTTQDKEKLFELQQMVAALKECFPMAEINPDFTFKSANDLFLSELGIKRIELKKSLPRNILQNGSYHKLEKCLIDSLDEPGQVEIDIQHKSGFIKKYKSTVIKINSESEQRKRGLLILQNVLQDGTGTSH